MSPNSTIDFIVSMSRSVVHGRVETGKIKIHCVVKGDHECLFDVEVGDLNITY